MARIRTIKPEFWTSEQVASCSISARLLFVGLWNFADDAGIHPASVTRAKMEIFPGDTIAMEDVASLIDELKAQKLLVEYSVDDVSYWMISGFRKHQKIDRPTFRHPGPENSTIARRDIVEGSANHQRGLDEPSPPEGKGRESKGILSVDNGGKVPTELTDFCKNWNLWHAAGLVSKRVQNPLSPSKTLIKMWKRATKDPEQRQRLSSIDELRSAVQRSIGRTFTAAWFDAGAVIGGKNQEGRWKAEQLLNGVYADDQWSREAQTSKVDRFAVDPNWSYGEAQ